MNDSKKIYLNLFIISATVICFEIVSTRISSVIFVNNYAFIILSLAILGLASGSIYSYYKIKTDISKNFRLLFNLLILAGLSLIVFIFIVIELKITNPFIYFLLQFFPYFFFGIIYSQIFKTFAEISFKIYASDLLGATFGSIASLFVINIFGASNSVLLLAILIYSLAGIYIILHFKKYILLYYSIISILLFFLIINGDNSFIGRIPIGNFPEKDFYYVYPNANEISEIIDSRWSIYGRSDLVQYNNQDAVKQLFVDGSAGSQMYRFNGDVRNPNQLLLNLLVRHSNSIPFFLLDESEKNNMLVIGPGGGKEILMGLFGGIEQITGVEINPDFVGIVKSYKDFNGGIYTDFPNVQIEIEEGRHFVRKTDRSFDLIVIALPSTEQLQSIDNLAMNENYLLTEEAIQDYLKILTPEGQLIITVHNKLELVRLITTSMSAFNNNSIDNQEFLNHIFILEQDYAPTVVIKKNSFTINEIKHIQEIISTLPEDLPSITYLPFQWGKLKKSVINNFLIDAKRNRMSIEASGELGKYNIVPCRDDSPYFYKITKGIPEDYLWLLISVVFFNLLLIGIPMILIKRKNSRHKNFNIIIPLVIVLCIGIGFMIIEVSLFQKLVLFLGSPTVSLSVLLSSLLIGMGIGSFFGEKIFKKNIISRLYFNIFAIVVVGIILFLFSPFLFNRLFGYNLFISWLIVFFVILPFGFLLGIPFPMAIKFLKLNKKEEYIPWMYGINGAMSVLGSVIAVISSMVWGFSATFYAGISVYFILLLILLSKRRLNPF